jgi:hypothetical protein
MPPEPKLLKSVFTANRRWIFCAYTLLTVEFAVFAILPHLLGNTIDSLLKDEYRDFWIYVGAFVVGITIGTTRRRLDVRVFQQVWVDKSLESIKKLRERGVGLSFILSRVGWIRTYGDFFEFTVPSTFNCVIEIVISAAMIWLVIPVTAYLLIGLALVGILSTYIFSFYVQRVQMEWQKLREDTDARIVSGEFSTIEEDYDKMRHKHVRHSDLDAFCWRWIEILSIVSSIIAIFALVRSNQSVGSIMATLVYTGKLFEKSGILSFFFNHLKEIQMVDKILERD